MPELPEAETIVRGLREAVVGATILRARVSRPDVLRQPPPEFRAMVGGGRIKGVDRRGKNVIIALGPAGVIAVNLGMTGRLLPFPRPPRGRAMPTHVAVRFALDGGGILFYDDVRRFGTVEALSDEEWCSRSRALGPEPLDPSFTPQDLLEACACSRSPIRSWLLDQKRIAGVGNIYANEALFHSGISPARPACTLSRDEAFALHQGLRDVLSRAIEARGTTLRDYRDAFGVEGSFGPKLSVYGREDEPCPGCSTPIDRMVISNRSAFHCPECQT